VTKKLVEGQRDEQKRIRALVGDLGEPFHFGINDLLPLAFGAGFRSVRTVSFDQACLSLTGTYDRNRAFRFQMFGLVSRTPQDPP